MRAKPLRSLKLIAATRLTVFLLLLFAASTNAGLLLAGYRRSSLIRPSPTTLFENTRGLFLAEKPNQQGAHGFWAVEGELPERIVASVIASEDRRYYRHPGVDPTALLRSIFFNLTTDLVQGASTIPMQVARMQMPAERNLRNKVREIYTALFMILRSGREEVLRHYLAIAPQGNQMHGFAYSSRRYFRKPLEDLSWAEAALLTSLIRSPSRLNLFDYSGFLRARRRAGLILSLLHDNGTLDLETYHISLSHLRSLPYRPKENRPENSYHYILRLLDSYTPEETGHLHRPVRTTLDSDIQQYLQLMADVAMQKFRPFGAGNIALMVVEKNSGSVLGYIGSHRYFDEKYKGSINYAITPRSSGSTLKPFLFALGLQSNDFTPGSIVADLPFHVLSPSGEYTAGNFDNEFLGPMLYRRALANSRNIPPLRVLEAVGLQKTYSFFSILGLNDTSRPADYYGYGLVLGGLYTSLEQIIRAYGSLANDGKAFQFRWIDENPVETDGGRHLISESAARQISLFLSDPLSRLPSFPRLHILDFPFPVAIKTGTSEGFRDAWTIGYSSKYIVGVWIGHPDNEPMDHVPGSSAAEIVHSVFLHLQPEARQGIDEHPFPPPRAGIPARICVMSGNLASSNCSEVIVEYFEEGSEPHAYCEIHVQSAGQRNGGHASAQQTVKAVFPPEYAAWAAKNGYDPPSAAQPAAPKTDIQIVSPLSGSRIVIDPETPRNLQSLPLRAEVTPPIPSVVWYVDGEPYNNSGFPYEVRWRLEEGEHTFQAKFARANVFSDKIYVTVSPYR